MTYNTIQNPVKAKQNSRHPLSHKSSDTSMLNEKSYKEELSHKAFPRPKVNDAVHATPKNERVMLSSQRNSEFRDQRLMSIDSQKNLNAPYFLQSMDNFSQFSTERRISNTSSQQASQYGIQDPRYQNMRSNSAFGYIPQPQPNYNLQPLLISPTNFVPVPQNFNFHPGYTQMPPPRGLVNCMSPSGFIQVQPQFPLQYQQNYGRSVTPIQSTVPFNPNPIIITNRGYENMPLQGPFPQQIRNPLASPNGFTQQAWERPMPETRIPQQWNSRMIVHHQNQGMPLYPVNGMQGYQTQPYPTNFDSNPSRESFQSVIQHQQFKDPSVTSFDSRAQTSAGKTLRN